MTYSAYWLCRTRHQARALGTLLSHSLCPCPTTCIIFIMPLRNKQLLQLCLGCSDYGIRVHKFVWFQSSNVLPKKGIKYIKEAKGIEVYKYFLCRELNPWPHAALSSVLSMSQVTFNYSFVYDLYVLYQAHTNPWMFNSLYLSFTNCQGISLVELDRNSIIIVTQSG